MNRFPLIALGVASTNLNGDILAVRYTKIAFQNEQREEFDSIDSISEQINKEEIEWEALPSQNAVSYTHLRAHETREDLVSRHLR